MDTADPATPQIYVAGPPVPLKSFSPA
jgi:hypothetical protein